MVNSLCFKHTKNLSKMGSVFIFIIEMNNRPLLRYIKINFFSLFSFQVWRSHYIFYTEDNVFIIMYTKIMTVLWPSDDLYIYLHNSGTYEIHTLKEFPPISHHQWNEFNPQVFSSFCFYARGDAILNCFRQIFNHGSPSRMKSICFWSHIWFSEFFKSIIIVLQF